MEESTRTVFERESSLGKLWEVQSKFTNQIHDEKQPMTTQQICHSTILHLYQEVGELLDAVGGAWKLHVKQGKDVRKSQVLLEVVDITKLAWAVAIENGITAEEFERAFLEKSVIVDSRRKCEKFLEQLGPKDKLVILDMDGVLTAYPESFLEYIEMHWMGDPMGKPYAKNLKMSKLRSADDLWTQLGMDMDEYQAVKQAFWESTKSRLMPMLNGAKEFVQTLKRMGYKVAIVTSRDKGELAKMEMDSYLWVLNRLPEIDAVFFAKDKARFIKHTLPQTLVVIEDNVGEVGRIQESGISALVMKRPYNPQGMDYETIISVIGKMQEERDDPFYGISHGGIVKP